MRGRVIIPIAVLAAVATAAQAGERITLRNGFEIRCDRHAEVEGHVRLYMSAGTDNYIEFAPKEIADVQPATDPDPIDPAPPVATKSGRDFAAASSSSGKNAKLSPADLHEILAKASGEIDRHLGGTRIAARAADKADLDRVSAAENCRFDVTHPVGGRPRDEIRHQRLSSAIA